jgi:predicted AlkP superfamily phosphohydrolase/phosphomutase
MKKRRPARLWPLLLVPVLVAGVFFGLRLARPAPAWPRVMIIGVDGLGWNVLQPLLGANALPEIRSLMAAGSYGTLETIAPTKSSVIWTSVATGKTMVKHGIVDWTYVDKHDIEVPYRQSERRAKAFWNILTDQNRLVGVVNWFVTFPPERVNGFMVSDSFSGLTRPDFNKVTATFPPNLQKLLRPQRFFDTSNIFNEQNVPDYRRWKLSGAGGDPLGLIPFFPRFFFQEETTRRVSLTVLQKFKVETLATYFRLADVVSHFAAEFIDPALIAQAGKEEKAGGLTPATEATLDAAYSKVVEPIYAYEDKVLGELFRLASPRTTFIICSDHSFYYHQGHYDHHEEPRIPNGVIFLRGPHIREGYQIQKAHIYDILPTLLYLLDLPVGEDMDGKVLTEAFDEGFVRKNPIKRVATYEGKTPAEKVTRDRTLDRRLLEELRALGYIK